MYIRTQKQSKRTKAFGIVSAVAITAGGGLLLNSMTVERDRIEQVRTELVMIEPPPPPPIEIPEPPKVDVVEEVEAPPAPPPLVAPEIDFVPDEPPVITAPVADPVILPDPVPVAPNPAPAMQTRSSPKLIASDKPDYPSSARRAGEQGTTQLEVCVSTGGRVTSVKVSRSSGSKRLDDAAAQWIRGERFQPAKVNGVASDVCGHSVYYEWSLRDA
jgi:protein TonB